MAEIVEGLTQDKQYIDDLLSLVVLQIQMCLVFLGTLWWHVSSFRLHCSIWSCTHGISELRVTQCTLQQAKTKFSRNYVERCLRKCIFCPNGQIVEVCIVPLNLVAVRSAAGKRQGGRPVEMISNHAARSLAVRPNSHQAERHNGALEKSGVSNNRHLEKLGGIQ